MDRRLVVALWTGLAAVQFAGGLLALRRASRPLPSIAAGRRHDLATSLTAGELSIIIPARNEQATIADCLQGAAAAAGPNTPVVRIVVVDDRSTDGTSLAVRRWADHAGLSRIHQTEGLMRWRLHRHCVVELLEGRPLAAGWFGKAYALAQGATLCEDSSWLLFLDADTRLERGACAALVSSAEQHRLDLLSILTRQRLLTWWEKLFQPAVFGAIAVGFPPDATNDPRHPEIAIANGQCLLVRRDTYEALGGHAAVRASIAEDQQLAALFKRSGHRIMLADGRSLAETRMYATFPAFWEGWTKNIFQASGASFGLIALAVGFFGFAQLAPGPLALLAWSRGQRPAAALWGASLIVQLALRRSADRYAGLGPAWSLTQPIGSAGFLAVMAGSAWRAARGTTAWRGRVYDVRATHSPVPAPSLWQRIRLTFS